MTKLSSSKKHQAAYEELDRALSAAFAEPPAAPTPPPLAETPLPRLAYTMRETAQVLGISYISVYRLIQRKQLKACDALRHRLIPVTEIERFLKETCK